MSRGEKDGPRKGGGVTPPAQEKRDTTYREEVRWPCEERKKGGTFVIVGMKRISHREGGGGGVHKEILRRRRECTRLK